MPDFQFEKPCKNFLFTELRSNINDLCLSKNYLFYFNVRDAQEQSFTGALQKSCSKDFRRFKEIIFVGVPLYQIADTELVTLLKRRFRHIFFFCRFCKISQNSFFSEQPWKTVSGCWGVLMKINVLNLESRHRTYLKFWQICIGFQFY